MTNKPKIIQIMPLIGNAAHRYTDSDVIGVALMDNGKLMPIVMYDDDHSNYFIDVCNTTKEALWSWHLNTIKRMKDIEIAEKKLAEWENPAQAGLDILTFAQSIHSINPSAALLPIVENVLGLSSSEASAIVQGMKEINAEQCIALCERCGVSLDSLPLSGGRPVLPF